MSPRLSVVLAAGVLACGALVACSDAEPVAAPVTPSRYISLVQELLDPPARLASMIAESTDAEAGRAPSQRRLQDLVDTAQERLDAFRGLRVQDAALRGQRDRLASAYADLIPRMQAAADALDAGERAEISRTARPFLDSLSSLPSAAASPASR